jgi:hypothetical protein
MERLLALCVCLAALSTAAHAENLASISFGCAPWDGQTLEISVGAPDITYKITVWGAGLTALEKGATRITLGKGTNMAGNGHSSVCGTRDGGGCHSEALAVVFDKAELKEGGAVAGTLDFRGMPVPFSGVLHGGQPCG